MQRIQQIVPAGKTLDLGLFKVIGPSLVDCIIKDGIIPKLIDTPAPAVASETEIKTERALRSLDATDQKMIRVIEDLITVLIQKGIISLSDFTQQVQDRLLERQAAREDLK